MNILPLCLLEITVILVTSSVGFELRLECKGGQVSPGYRELNAFVPTSTFWSSPR